MRFHRAGLLLAALLLVPGTSAADVKEPEALIQARSAYNDADYDASILAAALARNEPEWADAAALVMARAYLERFRARADPTDLTAAHDALLAIQAPLLTPRDRVDYLVGLGQYLFLTDAFGEARSLFDGALAQSYLLSDRDRLLLLDWWANALDRAAQARPAAAARAAAFGELLAGMEEELRRDAGNPVANYWLPVAARGAGELDRAWDEAKAGWVRARLSPASAATLRADLDRYVLDVLIPTLARERGGRTPDAAVQKAREEWSAFKQEWP